MSSTAPQPSVADLPPAGRRLNKVLNPVGFEPRVLYGQGKRATTITNSEGLVCPIIAHDAKNDGYDRMRVTSVPVGRIRRGVRPMHMTTMTIAKSPWEPDYVTTNMQFHGGSKTLDPADRAQICRKYGRSQIVFGGYGNYAGHPGHQVEDPNFWKTDYTQTYHPKEIIPANRLHFTSLVNRMAQSEGVQAKEVVRPNPDQPMSSFTQYKRIHDKLGLLRGPGAPRDYPIREQYNVITGEALGPAWKTENRRTSGNRVLHHIRQENPQVVIQ